MGNPDVKRAPVSDGIVAKNSRYALVDLSTNRLGSRKIKNCNQQTELPPRRSARISQKSEVDPDTAADEAEAEDSQGRTVVTVLTRNQQQQQQSSKSVNLQRKRTRSNSATNEELGNKRQRLKRGSRTVDSGVVHQASHTLTCSPFCPSKYTNGIAKYDTPLQGDVLHVPEYVADIFQRLFHAETQSRIQPYMHKQPELNSTMRMIVVDWIVEVHQKFQLEPATLYLCVNILDRYLSVTKVERTRLQLIGVTALLLACKYEEIYPPAVKDCVYITDRAYTRQEVLDTESHILYKLNFQLSHPTSYQFMKRFLLLLEATPTMGIVSNFYMDRVLQEHDFLEYRPSLIAAASVCLAVNNPDVRFHDAIEVDQPGIPKVLLEYTGFKYEDILEVATKVSARVAEVVVTASNRELYAVKHKYSGHRFQCVATSFDPPEADDLLVAADD